jgi:hypothetical protein
MIRDQGPWQSQQAGKPLEPGSHEGPLQAAQRLSVAEGVGRWAEELSLALTRSIEDHNRGCPCLNDSLMDSEVG